MAWGWSHTQEAYSNAYDNLSNESREFLEITYAEIHALDNCGDEFYNFDNGFDQIRYEAALLEAKRTPTDILVDFIWEFASNQATCDNGGFNAWVCPYGCHTVSFSKEGEDDEN